MLRIFYASGLSGRPCEREGDPVISDLGYFFGDVRCRTAGRPVSRPVCSWFRCVRLCGALDLDLSGASLRPISPTRSAQLARPLPHWR